MATLFDEIFSAIRGRCISDESASVAAAEVAELVVKKFTSTNSAMDAIAAKIIDWRESKKPTAQEYNGACHFAWWLRQQHQ